MKTSFNNRIITKLKNFDQLMLLIIFIMIFIVLSFFAKNFFTEGNIINVLRQASMTGIAAAGMTMVILLGEIDLAVGSQQALIGVFSAYIVNLTGGNVFASIVAGMLLGMICGLIAGLCITKLRIPSIITTLGTMTIISGAAKVSTNAVPIQVTYQNFLVIGTGYVGPIPIPVIIWFCVIIGTIFVLHKTTFGRQIYAIGGNQNSARLAGIPVDRIKVIVFVIAGALSAIAGIILAARMNSGQPTAGIGFELQVIAAVIIGGVSMAGGRGGFGGALLGVLILSVLSNGMILLHLNSFWQEIVRGVVIILAVTIDERRRKRITENFIQARFIES